MGHTLNKIFKMKYEMHAYGNAFEIENVNHRVAHKGQAPFAKDSYF